MRWLIFSLEKDGLYPIFAELMSHVSGNKQMTKWSPDGLSPWNIPFLIWNISLTIFSLFVACRFSEVLQFLIVLVKKLIVTWSNL